MHLRCSQEYLRDSLARRSLTATVTGDVYFVVEGSRRPGSKRFEAVAQSWPDHSPRYHHIHHADAAELAGKNLGSFFTFPDRLFGTYVSPDRVDAASLRFGLTDEKLNPIRLVIGL